MVQFSMKLMTLYFSILSIVVGHTEESQRKSSLRMLDLSEYSLNGPCNQQPKGQGRCRYWIPVKLIPQCQDSQSLIVPPERQGVYGLATSMERLDTTKLVRIGREGVTHVAIEYWSGPDGAEDMSDEPDGHPYDEKINGWARKLLSLDHHCFFQKEYSLKKYSVYEYGISTWERGLPFFATKLKAANCIHFDNSNESRVVMNNRFYVPGVTSGGLDNVNHFQVLSTHIGSPGYYLKKK